MFGLIEQKILNIEVVTSAIGIALCLGIIRCATAVQTVDDCFLPGADLLEQQSHRVSTFPETTIPIVSGLGNAV